MSDREFERYLAILGSLLRLSTNRREEIAAELRDHLEERLAELLEQGVSRNQAIMTALEEFGDAAGLAGEFLYVFHRQRRRWVMRMTVGSVAVCIALCLSIMALWPENRITPSGIHAVAQETEDPFGPVAEPPPEKTAAKKVATDPVGNETAPGEEAKTTARKKKADPFDGDGDLTPEENNKRTEAKLAKRMKVAYPQISVGEVLHDIAQRYEVDVFVKQKHLEDAGQDLGSTVELDFKNISGDMLLDLVLRGAGLNYTIQDGIVVVTTSDDLDSMMEVRVYNCRDLIALMHEHPSGSSRAGAGWGMPDASGGIMGGTSPASDPTAPGAGAMPGIAPRSGRSNNMAMPGMPGMGMPGMSGMPGMGMPGMSGMPGMGGMPGMEGMSGMPGMPGGESGMMGGLGGSQAPAGGGFGLAQRGGGSPIPDVDALIRVLVYTVMPDSWEEQGGPGTIEAYYGGLLIVNNNPQAHRKIDKLLKMIRDAADKPPGSVVREK